MQGPWDETFPFSDFSWSPEVQKSVSGETGPNLPGARPLRNGKSQLQNYWCSDFLCSNEYLLSAPYVPGTVPELGSNTCSRDPNLLLLIVLHCWSISSNITGHDGICISQRSHVFCFLFIIFFVLEMIQTCRRVAKLLQISPEYPFTQIQPLLVFCFIMGSSYLLSYPSPSLPPLLLLPSIHTHLAPSLAHSHPLPLSFYSFSRTISYWNVDLSFYP